MVSVVYILYITEERLAKNSIRRKIMLEVMVVEGR